MDTNRPLRLLTIPRAPTSRLSCFGFRFRFIPPPPSFHSFCLFEFANENYNRSTILPILLPTKRPRRSALLRWRRVAQHQRLSRQDQEGAGAARDVLRLQVGGRLPVQGALAAEEKAHGKRSAFRGSTAKEWSLLNKLWCLFATPIKYKQGVSSKNATNEVEIIRYQVLIPVTEVQVRASSAKDMDSHFLWELIHLRSQLQRRSEKVYVLSNR